MIKIGQGIDVHAFHNNGQQQQYVILAGVPIEHTHSLLHTLMVMWSCTHWLMRFLVL